MLTKGGENLLYVLVWMLGIQTAAAQYAPAAGLPGSSAISKDDERITEWASDCKVQRGYMNIANPSAGYATAGEDSNALGPAGRGTIVSLGDGGSAVLTFDTAIVNGPGFDFAVFENGFYTDGDSIAFLELAFVEVSSDGINYTRFPATTDIPTGTQLAMEGVNCRLINNLAGKYVVDNGTPFDLDELVNTPGLNVNHITHVRIVDAVGSINPAYATHDSHNNMVNDPWPTEFASSGFDLDAVGVLNSAATATSITQVADNSFRLYPNPVQHGRTVIIDIAGVKTVEVTDINGGIIYRQPVVGGVTEVPTANLCGGMYFITVETVLGNYNAKLLVQ